MMQNLNILEICYSADDNYAQHMGVSILSLFDNNSNFEGINVHVLANNISPTNKLLLENIAKPFLGRTIIFWDIHHILLNLKSKYDIPSTISISSYARLFITNFLSIRIERIIYVDADSAFMGKLDCLWSIDLSGYYVGGVEDVVLKTYKDEIGMSENDQYLNAGFLLINLKSWRDTVIIEKFIHTISVFDGNVPHHDQGVINLTCSGHKLILHPKYNVVSTFFEIRDVKNLKRFFGMTKYYAQQEMSEAVNHPVFIHFTPSFSGRPWILKSKHPYRTYYEDIKKRTGWVNIPAIKDNRKISVLILQWIFQNFGHRVSGYLLNVLYHLKKDR